MNVAFSADAPASVAADVLAVAVSEAPGDLDALDAAFGGHLRRLVQDRRFQPAEDGTLRVPSLGFVAARELVLLGVGDGAPARRVAAAGRLGRELRGAQLASLALDLGAVDSATLGGAIEALLAGNYAYEAYKPADKRTPPLAALTVLGEAPDGAAGAVERALVRARWQGWARDLVNAPPAEIYPMALAARAGELSALGIEVEVWDAARCEAEGCVGILAVGAGSARPGCMVRASWRPEGARAHVALVGKGITFDSGGLSIKPSAGMQTMRCDMAGAATVLAAVAAVAEARLPVAVDAWVASAENMTGPAAYKLGDVLTYANGVTVEIHNTDAEGRLVLADALLRACRVPGVTHVVDAATLTGACVVALGNDLTGLFTEDDGLAGALDAAFRADGELAWRLPMHKPYAQQLKGDWGAIKNVGAREAGATTAALFLQHFVEGVRWAHLDIAGPAFTEKPSGPYAAGATGQAVRPLVTWIEGLAR